MDLNLLNYSIVLILILCVALLAFKLNSDLERSKRNDEEKVSGGFVLFSAMTFVVVLVALVASILLRIDFSDDLVFDAKLIGFCTVVQSVAAVLTLIQSFVKRSNKKNERK